MIHGSKILVIIGSMRAKRIGPDIAGWVAKVGRETIAGDIEIVDLKDWPLPMDDEPGIPAGVPKLGDYTNEHTRAWSRKIAGANAFVFVTPQYNWGYPAPLKNALDHLYTEWSGKPAMIVSYGSRGGGKCAVQLRQVLNGLHMKPVASVGLKLPRAHIEANTGTIEPAKQFASHAKTLKRVYAELSAALSGKRRWFQRW